MASRTLATSSHTITVTGYPRDAICVRPPGCVWSTRATGEVAFLSIDIADYYLPAGGLHGRMQFLDPHLFPDLRHCVRVLRSSATALAKEAPIVSLLDAVIESGLFTSSDFGAAPRPSATEQARDMLESLVSAPPSLRELATAVGGNHFVHLRDFFRKFGVTPHAFVLRLRVERARSLLARGCDLAEVADGLGFADQSHMSRLFKRVFGVTPGAYRRRVWPGY